MDEEEAFANPASYGAMRMAALKRLRKLRSHGVIERASAFGGVHLTTVPTERDVHWFVALEFKNGQGGTSFLADVGFPLLPVIDDQLHPINAWGEAATAAREALDEALKPAPVKSGVWWADSDMYLVRPVYEGESSDLPPKEGWMTIDPNSYKPRKVRAK